METVEGRAPTDNPPYVFAGWLLDATHEERRALDEATARIIAQVHEVAVSAVGSMPVPEGDALRAHVQGQRDFYAWTHADDGVRVPLIERAFDWLEENWPADPGDPVLLAGVTPGRATSSTTASSRPRCSTGRWPGSARAGSTSPGPDVLHLFFQDIARSSRCRGCRTSRRREEFASSYAALSGTPIHDLHWYVVYGLVRYAIVMARIKRRRSTSARSRSRRIPTTTSCIPRSAREGARWR